MLKSKKEDADLASRLVERWSRFVQGLSGQQRTGLALLLLFVVLVGLQMRSHSTHDGYLGEAGQRSVDRVRARRAVPGVEIPGNLYVVYALSNMAVPAPGHRWQSVLQGGTLVMLGDVLARNATTGYKVDWEEASVLSGSYSHGGARGMALSCLQFWKAPGQLFTCDNQTGIIFELNLAALELYPRWILASGDGNSERPFKCTWMATKDGRLFTGSTGKEWVEGDNTVHTDSQWVKVIPGDRDGRARNVLWESVYAKVRGLLECQHPGCVIHEAVQWSEVHQEWFFLPYVSSVPSNDQSHNRAGNVLIRCKPSMSQCSVVHIAGPHNPKLGFSDFKFIPDGTDSHIVAIRTLQESGTPKPRFRNFLMVFNLEGKVIMKDVKIPGNHKFEGVALLPRG